MSYSAETVLYVSTACVFRSVASRLPEPVLTVDLVLYLSVLISSDAVGEECSN